MDAHGMWQEKQLPRFRENYLEIWILFRSRRVLLTDLPGPPEEVIVGSDGTIGGTIFPGECWIPCYGMEEHEAKRLAEIAAQVRGWPVSVALEAWGSWEDEEDDLADDLIDPPDDGVWDDDELDLCQETTEPDGLDE